MWLPRILGVLCLVVCSGIATYGESPQHDLAKQKLADGVYLILRRAATNESKSILGNEERRVSVPHDSQSHTVDEGNDWLVVPPTPEVRLVLTREPRLVTETDGGNVLMIEIDEGADRDKLRDATEKHLNQQLALIVDGEVVMTPRIRSVITDGRLQISACYGSDLHQLKCRLWPAP